MAEKKQSLLYRFILCGVRLIYPRMELLGTENLPDGPAVIVGNHAQLHGPVACELNFPENRYTWCAGEMMNLRDVPAYAYHDFWSQKPRRSRWFYRLASYLIAPLSVLLFNNAYTIPVWHDSRVISTFRTTVQRLAEGARVVIFPEHDVKYNNILYDFQTRFTDVARLYWKKTGEELTFVPMYIAPRLRKIVLGAPVRYCAGSDPEKERRRICDHLMEQITRMARELPPHTVVPYRNIPKRDYPTNHSTEETVHEEACC